MSQKYLFAAEVNRIQDTLFRASRQRQVVGGSRLLVEFGKHAARLAGSMGVPEDDILVTDGGNFRILFAAPDEAEEFGRRLTDAYRHLLNAPMTVAPIESLVMTDASHFPNVHKKAGRMLNDKKLNRISAQETPHAPTTAFCDYSGEGLASNFGQLVSSETGDDRYISRFSFNTAWVGFEAKDDEDSFLNRIKEKIVQHHEWQWPKDVSFIQSLDRSKQNVAYLVADGNNVGKMFSKCQSSEELKVFSDTFNEITRQAVAAPMDQLVNRLKSIHPQVYAEDILPILPLIVAGDDVFLLMPALYALDYARQFCLAYEAAMEQSNVVQQLLEREGLPMPSMSAAVVFCKGNYPYHLAHQRGEALLKQTKHIVKYVNGKSAVSFDVIVGSELVAGQEQTGSYRTGLGTYWAHTVESGSQAWMATLDLPTLFDVRRDFQRLPAKRRAETRELFDNLESLHLPDEQTYWKRRLARLEQRLRATDPAHLNRLRHALNQLGDPDRIMLPYWKNIKRADETFYTHGLTDLLTVWDYAWELAKDPDEYTKERAQ